MSFTGTTLSAGGGGKPFFCYQCNRTVTVTVSPADDPFCPLCNGGFLEEYENPNPSPTTDSNPARHLNPFADPFFSSSDPFASFLPLLFPSSPSDLQNPTFIGTASRSRSGSVDHAEFDPFAFLQNHLQHLRSGGAQIQFVIENNPSDSGFRLPSNIGDYFVGPGLEQLIQQLAENDPNRYGTPPASKSAIDTLPTVKVTHEFLNTEMNQCAVCMDEFDLGAEAKQMPCKHLYHKDCILPWLELHNSCPVCRHELPTDDPDYERRRVGGNQGSSGSDGPGGEAQSENQAAERRFRISLPWPFGGHGSTSDGGAGS
ncbi:E3 ubiquitin-protein ligase RING1 [Tripterygium wilfordii]|uniref:RING-type E3 ubiquitin transferase n=1 Tax=Tripterygium wilfordii TaxID=458696 RepID=A0A7J7DU16_TRIWF|nr:E3 ubiquitin-protein ligase RING1 [Tripterygium wilfordii]XP_038697499.1 E3 ubiquitin-protein ligase RING1 [Tripterygium wilfordii]KAF5749862.1 E3 ubiquitin-protein ligase RING1 [Tripterygium wilfordii]